MGDVAPFMRAAPGTKGPDGCWVVLEDMKGDCYRDNEVSDLNARCAGPEFLSQVDPSPTGTNHLGFDRNDAWHAT
jgi:hypothetical protein